MGLRGLRAGFVRDVGEEADADLGLPGDAITLAPRARPEHDGELGAFMQRLTTTHVRRWHLHRKTVGCGHLYQGTYKSFPIEADEHLLAVLAYVERNALRAGLVERAEDWRWSSLWRGSIPK